MNGRDDALINKLRPYDNVRETITGYPTLVALVHDENKPVTMMHDRGNERSLIRGQLLKSRKGDDIINECNNLLQANVQDEDQYDEDGGSENENEDEEEDQYYGGNAFPTNSQYGSGFDSDVSEDEASDGY